MQRDIESRPLTGVIKSSAENRKCMAIIDIIKTEKEASIVEGTLENGEEKAFSWETLFSSLCARFFFLVLIVFDAFWFCYLICKVGIYSVLHLAFLGSSTTLQGKLVKNWVSIKRSLICALSLVVALFSPAFGVMIGCTYFLMYDKKGIEEVVPASLRAQFKELFSAVGDA